MENRFDLYDLPEGHEERFLAKLDAAETRKRKNRVTLRWTAVAAAAAALLVLFLLPGGNRYFTGARTSEAVYCAYLDRVGTYYEKLSVNGATESAEWEAALAAMTDETIPLFDQLPEEMSSREKVRILKQYYGDLLDGAAQLKKEWNN